MPSTAETAEYVGLLPVWIRLGVFQGIVVCVEFLEVCIPWHEGVVVLLVCVWAKSEHKLHIFLRVYVGGLCSLHQRIEEAGGVDPVYGLAEQPVPASNRKRLCF